jgi:hypothetical protein
METHFLFYFKLIVRLWVSHDQHLKKCIEVSRVNIVKRFGWLLDIIVRQV